MGIPHFLEASNSEMVVDPLHFYCCRHSNIAVGIEHAHEHMLAH